MASTHTNHDFKPTDTWYEDADRYWKKVSSSDDGMLGGLQIVHTPDIHDSRAFLASLLSDRPSLRTAYACDCGAGIGRVSKHLLLPVFDSVDLVEQNSDFLHCARTEYLAHAAAARFINQGLQAFTPEPGKYDVVWCQWVLSHLTDADLAAFVRRAARALRAGGLVCVKENVARAGYIVDSDDSSVTRSAEIFERLFADAGVSVVASRVQTGFPRELFAVHMWALAPLDSN